MSHRSPELDNLLFDRVKVTFKDGCTCSGKLQFKEDKKRYILSNYTFYRTDGIVLKGCDDNAFLFFSKSNMKKIERVE